MIVFLPPGRPKVKTHPWGAAPPRQRQAWGLFFICLLADNLSSHMRRDG